MDRTPSRTSTRSVARWGLASMLALVALIGLISVAVVIVWALGDDMPWWGTPVLGLALALGATGFAWVIARALRS